MASFFLDLFAYATGAGISGTLRRRAPKALEAEIPVRFPVDFNNAKPFDGYMASPEYKKWKAYKNGPNQPE